MEFEKRCLALPSPLRGEGKGEGGGLLFTEAFTSLTLTLSLKGEGNAK